MFHLIMYSLYIYIIYVFINQFWAKRQAVILRFLYVELDICFLLSLCKKKVKVNFYIAQYLVHRTAQSAFTHYFPGRPVQSNTISTSLGSIQPHATINVRKAALSIAKCVASEVFVTCVHGVEQFVLIWFQLHVTLLTSWLFQCLQTPRTDSASPTHKVPQCCCSSPRGRTATPASSGGSLSHRRTRTVSGRS